MRLTSLAGLFICVMMWDAPMVSDIHHYSLYKDGKFVKDTVGPETWIEVSPTVCEPGSYTVVAVSPAGQVSLPSIPYVVSIPDPPDNLRTMQRP